MTRNTILAAAALSGGRAYRLRTVRPKRGRGGKRRPDNNRAARERGTTNEQ
jgi:hypothetical protein